VLNVWWKCYTVLVVICTDFSAVKEFRKSSVLTAVVIKIKVLGNEKGWAAMIIRKEFLRNQYMALTRR